MTPARAAFRRWSGAAAFSALLHLAVAAAVLGHRPDEVRIAAGVPAAEFGSVDAWLGTEVEIAEPDPAEEGGAPSPETRTALAAVASALRPAEPRAVVDALSPVPAPAVPTVVQIAPQAATAASASLPAAAAGPETVTAAEATEAPGVERPVESGLAAPLPAVASAVLPVAPVPAAPMPAAPAPAAVLHAAAPTAEHARPEATTASPAPSVATPPASPPVQELRPRQSAGTDLAGREEPDPEPAPAPRPLPTPKPPEPRRAARSGESEGTRRPPRGNAEASSRRGASEVREAGEAGAASAARRAAGDGAASSSSYKGEVLSRIRRAQSYPEAARARGAEGTAVVAFSVAAGGGIAGLRLERGSGEGLLDGAALDIVRRAGPFPPVPAGLPVPMAFRVPIRFDLR